MKNTIALNTHFNEKKISGLFRNLSSLNILELIKLKADYKSIGYSTKEVESHLYKLLTFPLYLAIMTVVSSIIMFNIKRNKPVIFHVILGIFLHFSYNIKSSLIRHTFSNSNPIALIFNIAFTNSPIHIP